MQEKSYRIHIRQGEFEIDVEGDRAFVEAYVEAFLAEENDLVPFQEVAPLEGASAKRLAGREPPVRGNRARRAPRQEVSADRTALKAYMRGKRVESNKMRYFQYMKFWYSLGEKQVGDRHIQACFLAENLPMPPTGRQNFGSLRKDGLVKAGTGRGLWALTSLALERPPTPTRKSRGPKVTSSKKAKPGGRKGEQSAAKGAAGPRKRGGPQAAAPAKRSAPRKSAKGKAAPETTPTAEGV